MKKVSKTSFTNLKFDISVIKTVSLIILSRLLPPASKTDLIFSRTCSTSFEKSSVTKLLLIGLIAICPDVKTRFSKIDPWEYAQIALGAFLVLTLLINITTPCI
tara:strand:- start:259 stop:570 length:312 start_codon:yes stop_codon:yes gene_type:complete